MWRVFVPAALMGIARIWLQGGYTKTANKKPDLVSLAKSLIIWCPRHESNV